MDMISIALFICCEVLTYVFMYIHCWNALEISTKIINCCFFSNKEINISALLITHMASIITLLNLSLHFGSLVHQQPRVSLWPSVHRGIVCTDL